MFWWEVTSGESSHYLLCSDSSHMKWQSTQGRNSRLRERGFNKIQQSGVDLATKLTSPHLGTGLQLSLLWFIFFLTALFPEQRPLQLWMDMDVTFWLELCFSADIEVTERKSGGEKSQASSARHMPLLSLCLLGKEEMQSRKGKSEASYQVN